MSASTTWASLAAASTVSGIGAPLSASISPACRCRWLNCWKGFGVCRRLRYAELYCMQFGTIAAFTSAKTAGAVAPFLAWFADTTALEQGAILANAFSMSDFTLQGFAASPLSSSIPPTKSTDGAPNPAFKPYCIFTIPPGNQCPMPLHVVALLNTSDFFHVIWRRGTKKSLPSDIYA